MKLVVIKCENSNLKNWKLLLKKYGMLSNVKIQNSQNMKITLKKVWDVARIPFGRGDGLEVESRPRNPKKTNI